MKLTKKQISAAVQKSARKYGYSASTIRAVSVLFYRAIAEFKERLNVN